MKIENTFSSATTEDLRTILLVDDSPVNLGVVVESLEAHGYEVLVAVDGEEAMQRIELVRPDLVLLDVMMPGMDGFEVCRELKTHPCAKHIPVIFMTSLGAIEDKVKGFEAGAVDYVTKPLQVDEVYMRVNTHLQIRSLQLRLEAKNAKLLREIARREAAEQSLQRSFEQVADLNAGLNAQLTQLEAMQELLERTSAWYGNIMYTAPDCMLVVDEAGSVMQANARGEAMFGYAPDGMSGVRLETLLPGMKPEALLLRTDFSMDDATEILGGEACRSDGVRFPVTTSLSQISGLDGEGLAFGIVVRESGKAAGERSDVCRGGRI